MKTLIVIAGPTAVGKTAHAVRLARELDTEIVSCDSRQFYREMRIGVARPTDEELAAAVHHFIACHSADIRDLCADFQRFARLDFCFGERKAIVPELGIRKAITEAIAGFMR